MSLPETKTLCPAGLSTPVAKCCPDLGRKLADILRALNGRQFHAARNLATALYTKYPDRPCLLLLLWLAHERCGEKAKARQVCETLAGKEPRWPAVFWARMAAAIYQRNLLEGLLAYVDLRENFPQAALPEFAGELGESLVGLARRCPSPWMATWLLRSASPLLSTDHRQYLEGIIRPDVDVLLVGPGRLLRPQPGGRVPRPVGSIRQLVKEGRLASALKICERWRRKKPGDFPAWWNTLALQLWLGRDEDARQTLDEMPQAGLSEAQQAEAWAAYFSYLRPWYRRAAESPVWSLKLPWETFTALGREAAVKLLIPPRPRKEEDELSYFAVYQWCEPMGEVGSPEPILRVDFVRAVGCAYFRSGQEAEMLWSTPEEGERLCRFLHDTTGIQPQPVPPDQLGDRIRDLEIVWTLVGSKPLRLFFQWHIDRHSPLAARTARSLIAGYIENTFPSTPLAELDGKTPAEAVADPQLRPRVLGLLWLLVGEYPGVLGVVEKMRERLGIAKPEAVDARTAHPRALPPIALLRVDPASVTAEFLARLPGPIKYFRSYFGVWTLWRLIAGHPELRKHLAEPAFVRLATRRLLIADSVDEAQEVLRFVEETAPAASSDFPTTELVRFAYTALWRNPQDTAAEFWDLRAKYWSDPHVMPHFVEVLRELRLLSPEGLLVEWLRTRPEGATSASLAGASAGGEASTDANLSGQTPTALGGESPLVLPSHPETGGEGERKLWVPGEPL